MKLKCDVCGKKRSLKHIALKKEHIKKGMKKTAGNFCKPCTQSGRALREITKIEELEK